MIYVSIDIAKLNHFAATISSDGEIVMKSFKFINDRDGFSLQLSKLGTLILDNDNISSSPESTAYYFDILVRCLVVNYYKVYVLTPIKISTIHKRFLVNSVIFTVSPNLLCCLHLLVQIHMYTNQVQTQQFKNLSLLVYRPLIRN